MEKMWYAHDSLDIIIIIKTNPAALLTIKSHQSMAKASHE